MNDFRPVQSPGLRNSSDSFFILPTLWSMADLLTSSYTRSLKT